MDTRTGELMTQEKAELRDPLDLESFEYGEVIQVKSGFFEVCKVDIQKQRLTLKPVSRDRGEQAEQDRMLKMRNAILDRE